jgi:hypothetical protein
MTNTEIQLIVRTTRTVAERIQAAGQIYSGHLFADLMVNQKVSYENVTAAVRSLKSGGLVTEGPDHLLFWQGIRNDSRPYGKR